MGFFSFQNNLLLIRVQYHLIYQNINFAKCSSLTSELSINQTKNIFLKSVMTLSFHIGNSASIEITFQGTSYIVYTLIFSYPDV